MNTPIKPLAEITQEAIRLLTQTIGPTDTMRFLGQFTNGTGNYTEERRAIYDDRDLAAVLTELKNTNTHATIGNGLVDDVPA